jgi:hypothetical protein
MIQAGDRVQFWSGVNKTELSWGRVKTVQGNSYEVQFDKNPLIMTIMDPQPIWIQKQDIFSHKVDWVARAAHLFLQVIQTTKKY